MVKVIDEVETIVRPYSMPEGGLRTEVTGMESFFPSHRDPLVSVGERLCLRRLRHHSCDDLCLPERTRPFLHAAQHLAGHLGDRCGWIGRFNDRYRRAFSGLGRVGDCG